MKKTLAYSLILVATFVCSLLLAQTNIRVQGEVTTPDGVAIEGVTIIYNSYQVAVTDVDGRFSCLVPRDAELLAYHQRYNKVKQEVRGQQEITIILQEQNQEISVVTVTAKMSQKAITIDKSDIEIRGNYFHLKTKFRVPKQLFTTDKRFIVQPTIYDATLKRRTNLSPVVIDGEKYNLNLYRQLNFDLDNDSLRRFVVENTLDESDNIYQYHDSIYIAPQNRNNDYRADCYQALVGYRPERGDRGVDTVTIAKGTKNPLRFLDYTFEPMELNSRLLSLSDGSSVALNYSALTPDPELELMSDKGSFEIEFKVNRTDIDYSNATNRGSIDTILDQLNEIQRDENATLKAISMTGYASPEGKYSSNKTLANLRTKSLLDIVTKAIDSDVLKYMDITYSGEVESWGALVALAEADDHQALADEIRSIRAKYGDDELSIQAEIVRLPDYRKLIKPRYLPQLRKVDYALDYSVFRPMSFEEIKAVAARGDKRLSRYEYYKLICEEPDSAQIVAFENEALEHYPNFLWDLNRVAVRILRSDSTNLDILDPIKGQEVPMPVTYNHALMALQDNNLSLADSLIRVVDQYRECNYIRSIILALNGYFEEAYPFISSRGGLNEVLIMLSMDQNRESFEMVSQLIDDDRYKGSAKAWYIHALCANRLNYVSESIQSLTHAFNLDESLVEIARLDSEVLDICELIRPSN